MIFLSCFVRNINFKSEWAYFRTAGQYPEPEEIPQRHGYR